MTEPMTREEYDKRMAEINKSFASGDIGLQEYQEKREELDLRWRLGHAENGQDPPA